MARSKRKHNAIEKAYFKERARIQSQQRSMLRRGYIISADALPPIPKKITAGSVRRLKKITSKKLYDSADFMDLTSGDITSGRRGREIERERAAQKGAETRQEKQWEQERRRQDEEDKHRIQFDKDYAHQFDKGNMMKRRVYDAINERASANPAMADRLKSLLEEGEDEQGEELWNRLADNPDVIDTIEGVFYESSYQSILAYNSLQVIIFNRALTVEETKESNDIYESDMPYESPD